MTEEPKQEKVTVFIAEDHELTAAGLKMVVEELEGYQLVGQADDGRSAVEKIAELKPDVVLMDVGLPDVDGIDATHQILDNHPDAKVMMMTSQNVGVDIFEVLKSGATGYCHKGVSSSVLGTAVKAVADGAAWLDSCVSREVLDACSGGGNGEAPGDQSARERLSQREYEVLGLMVEGLTNQQIGKKLFISPSTVKTHVGHIMEKLSVRDRTQAAIKAVKENLINLEKND